MSELKPFPITTYDEESHELPGGVVPGKKHLAKRPKNKSWLWLALAAIIAVSGIAGGATYWWLSHHKAQVTSNQTDTNQPPTPHNTLSSTNVAYISNGKDLNLGFTYPSDWSVTPASHHNSGDKPITLTSPFVSIIDTSGKTIVGKVVLQVRPASTTVSELSSGSGKAVLDSIQIAYSKPTPAQHAYPFVSYVNLSGDASTGKFDEIILTGALQFTKGQSISTATLQGLDPVISARFYECTNSSCSGAGALPLAINDDIWQNADIFVATQTILKSFQIN